MWTHAWSTFTSTVFLLALLLDISASQPAPTTNYFVYPVGGGYTGFFLDNPIWEIGSIQHIQWSTTYTSYKINLWQQKLGTGSANIVSTIYSTASGGDGEHSFDWNTQTYGTSLTDSPVYFLWLATSDTPPLRFASHYINLTDSTTTSTTASASLLSTTSSVPPPGTTTNILTTTISTPSSTAPATSNAASNSTLNPAASQASQSLDNNNQKKTTTIALGVGLGIGVPLILIAGIWLGYKLFRRNFTSLPRTDVRPEILDKNYDHKSPSPPYTHVASKENRHFYEAPSGSRSPVELAGS